MNQPTTPNAKQIEILCPTDALSYCYVLAMRERGLSNSIINGRGTKLLLIKGYDQLETPASRTFENAIIYGPNRTYVSDGILTLPASNAAYAFAKAIIYAENTPITVIAKISDGLISAQIFANESRNNFLYIRCDFNTMCDSMRVYIDNPKFNFDGYMPQSEHQLCWMCNPWDQNACANARLYIRDTTNPEIDNAEYYLDTAYDSRTSPSNWIFRTGEGQGMIGNTNLPETDGYCRDTVTNILNETWYWWYDPIEYLVHTNAPNTCDYVMMKLQMGVDYFVYEYRPPVNNFCFHTKPFGLPNQFWTWEQTCENGQLIYKKYNNDDTDCSGDYGIIPNDPISPNSLVNGDCTIQNHLCEYATYKLYKYKSIQEDPLNGTNNCESFAFEQEIRNAVFVNQCVQIDGIGEYYTCDQSTNTLTLNRYNDTFNCSGTPYRTIVYTTGTCMNSFLQQGHYSAGDVPHVGALYVENITCFGGPTPSPTNAPTPSCLSLQVDVIDDKGIFNESDFDGIYTFNSIKSQFNAPIWEKPPNNLHNWHVRYYGKQWIIHGHGLYNILTYESNSLFVPYEDLTANWIYSNGGSDEIFHVWIKCINSYVPTTTPTVSPTSTPTVSPNITPTIPLPTMSPTSAPTRNPTGSGVYKYEGNLQVVYVLENLSMNNYKYILNEKNIGKIIEIIEQHYFNLEYLPSYEYFMIQILKLNGINYNEATIDNIYNSNDNNNSSNILYLKSEIDFLKKYKYYVVTTSQNKEWHRNVTRAFSQFFQNNKTNFYVGNASELKAQIYEPEEVLSPSFTATFGTLNSILFICIIISILAYLYNSYSHDYICKGKIKNMIDPVDSSDYLAPTFYGLAIYDLISDINLTSEIFNVIAKNEINFIIKKYLLIAGIGSALCILIPYCLNIYFAAKIPSQTAYNYLCRTYFSPHGNLSLFITFVVFSGSCYSSLDLVSSNIFGLSMLHSGLCSFELLNLSEKRVLLIVLTYNIPSIIFQILYIYSIDTITPNTVLAFCTSFASVVGSLLTYIIHKDRKGKAYDIDYYLEIKHINKTDLDSDEKEHIQFRKGMKNDLSQTMVDTYKNIPIENFQIGFVTIRGDDFVIRIIQHLHEQDITTFSTNTNTNNSYDEFDNEYHNEYQSHCRNLYMANKTEINQKIFAHYYDLDKDKFIIEYHNVYPGIIDPKLAHLNIQTKGNNINNKENIQQMIQMVTTPTSPGDPYNTGNKKFDDNVFIFNNEGNLIGSEQPEIMNSHYEFWYDRRDQFEKGYELLQKELKKMKQENNGKDIEINSMQVHRFIRMLNDNQINPLVIEDVINFSVKSKTFDRNRRESDIDFSKTATNTQTHHFVDQQLEAWAMDND